MLANLFDYRQIVIAALIFLPLERLLPARPAQHVYRRHFWNDIVYLLGNGIVIRLGFVLLIAALMTWTGPVAADGVVSRWPFWLQVLAAVAVADAGFYAAHRAFHAVPFLWRFHSVHHSIEELDWLAAHRVHPVDQIVHSAASYLPLYLLGFPVEAIAAHGAIYLVQSHLIHANTRLGFGPLRHVLASPAFHHWHHTNEAPFDRNFAPSFTWLDRLFGTLHLPDAVPARYGTDDPVPHDYLRQLAWPFVRRAAPAPAAPEPA